MFSFGIVYKVPQNKHVFIGLSIEELDEELFECKHTNKIASYDETTRHLTRSGNTNYNSYQSLSDPSVA